MLPWLLLDDDIRHGILKLGKRGIPSASKQNGMALLAARRALLQRSQGHVGRHEIQRHVRDVGGIVAIEVKESVLLTRARSNQRLWDQRTRTWSAVGLRKWCSSGIFQDLVCVRPARWHFVDLGSVDKSHHQSQV
eukprot:Skav209865  [mRNA]  locus=scaffold1684:556553:565216:+ [translate_table: standard]